MPFAFIFHCFLKISCWFLIQEWKFCNSTVTVVFGFNLSSKVINNSFLHIQVTWHLFGILLHGKEKYNLLFNIKLSSFVNFFKFFVPSFIQLKINNVLKPNLVCVVTVHNYSGTPP